MQEVPNVAIDVGPLHGRRTGVGNAVAWTLDALADQPVELMPYLTSSRARVSPPERRLPIPAAAAVRWWARPAPSPVRHLHERWLGRPDVVHGTNYVTPPTTLPTMVSVYDCWFLEHPDDAVPDVRRAAAVLTRAAAEGAHVVTSSRATADRVRDLLGTDLVESIHLGPPPPPPPATTSRDPRGDDDPIGMAGAPFVVALGTVERRKNYPTLVRAFARLASEHPDARLVIAGAAGDGSVAVATALDSLERSVRDRVQMPGAVDEPTKHWLLANADVLAYPSLDEGFGFPILEAQQAGTPVVASTAGSIPEIAGSAALLSSPTDVDALAANLFWLLTSDEMTAKMIRRGRQNLERFSWQRAAASLSARYQALADSGA
ncbi:MAG: glycosyltransferase family 1 protein [Acidimicrobiia bacterium]|nr:glycosyltransferase family 1 protein [Acidimicrobiia bacterium]